LPAASKPYPVKSVRKATRSNGRYNRDKKVNAFAAVINVVCFFLRTFVPYMCFYLDRLDTKKTYTLNYGCICEKAVVAVR
jgi:hypothetical protein